MINLNNENEFNLKIKIKDTSNKLSYYKSECEILNKNITDLKNNIENINKSNVKIINKKDIILNNLKAKLDKYKNKLKDCSVKLQDEK